MDANISKIEPTPLKNNSKKAHLNKILKSTFYSQNYNNYMIQTTEKIHIPQRL